MAHNNSLCFASCEIDSHRLRCTKHRSVHQWCFKFSKLEFEFFEEIRTIVATSIPLLTHNPRGGSLCIFPSRLRIENGKRSHLGRNVTIPGLHRFRFRIVLSATCVSSTVHFKFLYHPARTTVSCSVVWAEKCPIVRQPIVDFPHNALALRRSLWNRSNE